MDTSPFQALLVALREGGPYALAWPALVLCTVSSAFSDPSPPWGLAAWAAAAGASLADAENARHFGPKIVATSRCAWLPWAAAAVAVAHAARSSLARRAGDRPAVACALGALALAAGGASGSGPNAALGALAPLADGRPLRMVRAACWTAAWIAPSPYSAWLLVASEAVARIAAAAR